MNRLAWAAFALLCVAPWIAPRPPEPPAPGPLPRPCATPGCAAPARFDREAHRPGRGVVCPACRGRGL